VTTARQFNLPFPCVPCYAPEEFLRGACNEAALAWMERPPDWPARRLAVHGEAGTGKTHLLHFFAARHGAALMPASAVRRFMAPLEACALGIDDADTVADAEALLHMLNAAAERGTPVLLTARTAPSYWGFTLPDLVSRLRATPAVALLPPEDGLLRALLARLLADRQMAVPERVQDFLLARLPRTGGALREAVARLDRLSMATGRAVTLGLAQLVVDEEKAGWGVPPPPDPPSLL
jgi:chromosomal replication initiation ATPase DnaA